MPSISVTAARSTLPQIVERVLAGEEITLTRHGRAVAVVVRPDALHVRRADAALASASRLRDGLADGRRRPLGAHPVLTPDRADELLAEVRRGREEVATWTPSTPTS